MENDYRNKSTHPEVADTKIIPSETTARLKLIGPSLMVCELILRLLCIAAWGH